jgi:hypothetical protein
MPSMWVVRAVLLEPLPFRAPQQLVQLWESHPELHNLQVAVPDYWDWKKSIKTLDGIGFTISGVVPANQAFPVWADVWVRLSLIDPATSETRKYHPLEVIGRLHPGTDMRQAETQVGQVARTALSRFSLRPDLSGSGLRTRHRIVSGFCPESCKASGASGTIENPTRVVSPGVAILIWRGLRLATALLSSVDRRVRSLRI